MKNEKLLAKRFKITALIFVVLALVVTILVITPFWKFLLKDIALEPWSGVYYANSVAKLNFVDKFRFILVMVFYIAIVFMACVPLSGFIFNILFIKDIEIYKQAEIEINLNEKFAVTEEQINHGFSGCRVTIIQEWKNTSNLEHNANYFLQKFEEKITIVDQKIDKNKVLISFKLK